MTDRPEPTRVEEIRERHADDVAALNRSPELLDPEYCDYVESWQDVADYRDLLAHIDALTAKLAEAERELDAIGKVIEWDCTEKTLLQAIKDEWHDFMMVCNHCAVIYDVASRGQISKPQTMPSEVIRLMEDGETERIEETVREAIAHAEQENAALRERVAGLEATLKQIASGNVGPEGLPPVLADACIFAHRALTPPQTLSANPDTAAERPHVRDTGQGAPRSE